MRTSVADLRRHFILMHGRESFEAIASAFVDVQGDSTKVWLDSIPAWHEFAESLGFVPRSDLVPKVFLWCVRHSQPLQVIDRPVLPAWLKQIDNSETLQKIVARNPFAIAASPDALRCIKCFDSAASRSVQILGSRKADSESQLSRKDQDRAQT